MEALMRNPMVRAIRAAAAMSSAVPMRLGQIVRLAPGGDNPASVFADGQDDGPGDPAAAADDQRSLIFQRKHLFLSFDGID
jgi:hypothetical protein